MSTSANEWKSQGNTALKSKDFGKAVECYSKAIEMEPSNHTFYSNRSAAYVYKKDYGTSSSLIVVFVSHRHQQKHHHHSFGLERRGEVLGVETGLGKGIHT